MFEPHLRWLWLLPLFGCAPAGVSAGPRHDPSVEAPAPSLRTSERPPVDNAPSPDAGTSRALASNASVEALTVPGFMPAVVYVPPGSEARPLVVATHGAGGVPEAECAYWVQLTSGQAFVLSLRGTPLDRAGSAFYYRNHLELGRELAAALQAMQAAYGARLIPRAGLYAGFSQGAIMAVGMIPAHAVTLPHLVLIEGGYEYWSVAQARKYAKGGGKRVLLACGTQWCADKSQKAAVWLRQAGVEARVEYAPGVGHTPAGGVMDRVAAALPWVVAGNAGWRL